MRIEHRARLASPSAMTALSASMSSGSVLALHRASMPAAPGIKREISARSIFER
jgi:hypothetical protein